MNEIIRLFGILYNERHEVKTLAGILLPPAFLRQRPSPIRVVTSGATASGDALKPGMAPWSGLEPACASTCLLRNVPLEPNAWIYLAIAGSMSSSQMTLSEYD